MLQEKKGYHYKIALEDHKKIVHQYENGMTLKQLGAQYGVTCEGIRRVIKKVDATKIGSGAIVRFSEKRRARIQREQAADEARERRCRATWGVSRAEYIAHVAAYGSSTKHDSPMHKFMHQRKNAGKRGIRWELTFAEWWRIWEESGRWKERGVHAGGYVMARYGDGDSPYSVGSVYICTSSENIKDGYISTPNSVRIAKRLITRAKKVSEQEQTCGNV